MRVLSVGLGPVGRHWVRRWLARDDVEAFGYVDPVKDLHKVIQDESGAPADAAYLGVAEGIAAVQPDLVLAATPPSVHRAVAEAAFAAGAHVIVEKPIAETVQDALGIVRAAEASGKRVFVAQNQRHTPIQQTARRLIHEGKIGELSYGLIAFYGSWTLPTDNFRYVMPYPLLLDLSVHHFDTARHLTGSDIARVTCHSLKPSWSAPEGDTVAMATLEMENGVLVQYSASWVSPGFSTSYSCVWRFEGSKGTLYMDAVENKGRLRVGAGRDEEEIATSGPDEGQLIIDEALAAIKENRESVISGRSNLNTFCAVHAAILSSAARRTVEVSEILGDEA